MKVAILADNGGLQRFVMEAVNAVQGCDEIALFRCTNTRFRRRIGKHGFYYALNLLAVVNRWTRIVPVECLTKRVTQAEEFESGYEGTWQTLPDKVIHELREYDVILKVGMGLLRVPPSDQLPVPILSYHHGDPDKYRGRPSGFWEICAGERVMGQIIQVIENRLDAGKVVAFAETKVMPWSYRATLVESYRHSPLIINEAIRNALARQYLPKSSAGPNYRLPSNLTVARFVVRMALRFLRRLLYGVFFEKGWQVSIAKAPQVSLSVLSNGSFPARETWKTLETAKGYAFYADPFFSRHRSVLVEALRTRTGLGEIVEIDEDGRHRPVSLVRGHMSYPFTFRDGDHEIVVPEMAEWSAQKIYKLEQDGLRETGSLRFEGGGRLADPTLFRHEGRLYLFANLGSIGSNALWLWSAKSIGDLFHRHPLSPICISPQGARMGGSLVAQSGRIYRLGQDFRSGYGDGLCVFEILAMSPTDYREQLIGNLRFDEVRGPHTLNCDGELLLFDWYRDRFSPLAGPRRLIARLLSLRSQLSGGSFLNRASRATRSNGGLR